MREAVKYVAVFVIILVVVLDVVSVLQAQLSVHDNARAAALEARAQYVAGSTAADTRQAAQSYLEAKDATFINATVTEGSDRQTVVVTVVARRNAHTYLFHYLKKLPWGLGDRVDRLLSPNATESSD